MREEPFLDVRRASASLYSFCFLLMNHCLVTFDAHLCSDAPPRFSKDISSFRRGLRETVRDGKAY
ncbi:hypothetical protein HMPREF0973_01267 [Prevotella veroralis F0319]|uniref:Uncharacterized protein n=1 Tax=Prevotella veroralis F0319 TaxID=649761 RepID=C9MNS9_9BACT|nr:hypothetical protein HMPREF0973_01267 [Prevotella veroralis F0319]